MRIIHQLVLLNGHLSPNSDDEAGISLSVDKKRLVLLLIKAVIAVLTIAMKFEPASAKHFVVEVETNDTFCDAIMLEYEVINN